MTDKNPQPWTIQPLQTAHGTHTAICDAKAHVLCVIPSAAWDEKAFIRFPEDRMNARLFACAKRMFEELKVCRDWLHGCVQFDEDREQFARMEALIAEVEGKS